MTSACGCEVPDPATAGHADADEHRPWWRDPAILVPALSGVALVAGLILEFGFAESDGAAEVASTALFWAGLILGGSTFAPGALRALFTRGRLGISLLMTISAVGAVILGHVEEAAALAFLYSIVEALEDKAMDRARAGLRSLLRLMPETATVRRGTELVDTPAPDLRVGQTLVVRPGERVATDGVVARGRSSLDTSAITGESVPVEVEPGDEVSAGSINTSGALELTTTAPGTDNSLTTIVDLVEQAQSEKGDRARLADRIARPLVPGVLVLAGLVAALGALLGDPELWISRALVVLVAASPCALAISVPVTVVSAIGAASRLGVVIKSGAAFERLGTIRHVAVDKTGTLTRNQPTVVRVLTADGGTTGKGGEADPDGHRAAELGAREAADAPAAEVLALAAAVERHSTHPLAVAITAAAHDAAHAPHALHATDVEETPGFGVTGRVDQHVIAVGSPHLLAPGPLAEQITAAESEGITVAVVHRDDSPIGAIGIRDELRDEVIVVVDTLTSRGLGVTMLTGDNPRTAAALAARAGIADVRAGLTPGGKAEAIRSLSSARPTAMIGDGVNDAPALAAADVGIAMGATGSDAAVASADVSFTGTDLRHIPRALEHARRGGRIIGQNVLLSLLLIVVLVPLAMTGVLGLAAVVLVHEVAEVLVILNGLRAARTPAAAPVSDPASDAYAASHTEA